MMKVQKREFLFIPPLLNKEKILIVRLHCTVSRCFLNLLMLLLLIFVFFPKSEVDPKYCLLAVDLFTSNVYAYTMNSRNLLSKKQNFFIVIFNEKENILQETQQQDFKQTYNLHTQKKIIKKYNTEMFSSCVRGGKAYAAVQKIREFKKLIFKSKRVHKATSNKRFDSRKLIRLAVKNMNNIRSQKYGQSPDAIEEKALESEKFREIYDFYRLVKVKQHAERFERANIKKDKVLRRKLRKPLKIGEKVLALAERIQKKDHPRNLFESTTKNISFFNCEQLVIVTKNIKRLNNKQKILKTRIVYNK